MSKQERKENIARRRKQQILDAALAVFSKEGFAQATNADIARTAGLAEGTIYNYFQSKRDVLVSLISSYILTESLRSLSEHPPEPDALSLSSLIEDRLGIGFGNVDGLMLLMTEMQRDPELRQQYAEQALRPALKLMKTYLQSGVDRDAFRPMNTDVVVRALTGMLIGLIVLYRIEGEVGLLREIPRQELAAEMAKLVFWGIQRK